MKKGVKIGIIAAVVIAICVAVFIFIKKRKSKTDISTTNPDTTSLPTSDALQKKVDTNVNTYNAISQGGSALTTASAGASSRIPFGTKIHGKGDGTEV